MSTTLGPPRRWDRASWAWLGIVLVVAAPLLLLGLGDGTLRPYDEGLYGKLARNALEHGQWLHAVDAQGQLYPDFTKPPLTIALVAASFQVLGISLATLRLPFALSMLGIVLVSFAWGRRIGGLPMAVAWAGVSLTMAASVRWGRVACIEPMLMLWVLLALWTYHEALLREGAAALRWAALAGLALALAVLTKQLVVGVAVAPILALELWRRDGRAAWQRLALALGIPAVVGAGWLGSMLQRHGQAAIDVLLHTGVLRRVRGFESGHSARTLNELATVVGEACEPFAWVLGVVGLVLLVLARPPRRRSADGALLLPLLLLSAVLIYDNVSSSLLPWYAFDLVVPLSAGLGYCIAGMIDPDPNPAGITRAVAGSLALAVGAITALAPLVSQLNAAVIGGLLVVVVLRLDPVHHPGPRRVLVTGLQLTATLALLAGMLRNPQLRASAGGHERLMQRFAAQGIERVHVDTDTRIASEHAWGTYYGPHAHWSDRPPWRSRDPQAPGEDAQAYVTATIWPREVRTTNGSEVVRAPGLMAMVGGDLSQPPWGRDTMAALLDAGPITFESEDLPSQRDDIVVDDPRASGAAARAVVPFANAAERAFLLAHGPGVRLPAGRYTAQFWLKWSCGAVTERPAAVVQVIASNRSVLEEEVACHAATEQDYEAVTVSVHLARPARVELRVKYLFGEVWHDRTLVRRAE
ncbi:MAG: phospholipid carrier-dependent glycosyltransferase [Nannocystaceae bacterium]